jgi:Hint domain
MLNYLIGLNLNNGDSQMVAQGEREHGGDDRHDTDHGGDKHHKHHHPVCFCAGTMICTPQGEVAVETLRRGDLVCTRDGRVVSVDWLGVQTVSTIFSDKLRVLPIRIKAGALSESVPARDLLVSPDHAILVEGALIQAGALINGSSIVRERNVPTVFTYYHVEVDDHALILAENTPAETFIDNVDRLGFDNWAEHQVLYPEGKPISELPYPRAKAHRQVPVNIRVKLAERAQLIGAVVDSAAVAG